jgi:inhibitor of cysteine peptidase
MFRLNAFVSAALLCAVAVVAAQEETSSSAQVPAASAVTVTDQDNGKTIQLSEGATLMVKLPSNASTGYSWSVKGNPSLLKLIKSDYSEQKRPMQVAGAPGVQTFQWQATETGDAKLQLEYRRPWEKNEPAAKTFSITLQVR